MDLNIRRLKDALGYDAPNHFDMRGYRLQGLEAGGAETLWVGLSYFLPDGGAGPDAGALEKVYVVLEGELTLRAQNEVHVLGPMDSVTIAPRVEREIRNTGKTPATMLVVMPRPAAAG